MKSNEQVLMFLMRDLGETATWEDIKDWIETYIRNDQDKHNQRVMASECLKWILNQYPDKKTIEDSVNLLEVMRSVTQGDIDAICWALMSEAYFEGASRVVGHAAIKKWLILVEDQNPFDVLIAKHHESMIKRDGNEEYLMKCKAKHEKEGYEALLKKQGGVKEIQSTKPTKRL